jgi:hypothetical protein
MSTPVTMGFPVITPALVDRLHRARRVMSQFI